MKEENSVKKWLYWFSLFVAVIVLYKLLDNFTAIGVFLHNFIKILMPFIIGTLIAYILYIPCQSIEECFKNNKVLRKPARGLSIFTVYLIIAIIIFILINVILPPIITSIKDLANNLPTYYTSLSTLINELPEDSIWIKLNAKEVLNQISSIDFAKYLSIESITEYIKGAISVATGIFDVFVTIIISIYTLVERERIKSFIEKFTSTIFKKQTYNILSNYFEKTNKVFFGFISGQLLDAVIIGIITSIAMAIMGVKYATLLGFLIGLFNLIPFFGAIIAVAISIFITLCTGGINKAIWLAVVVIALQQIDANIINPKIIGDKLKISPILVIFSVTFAGAYFGILGMFLGVPIVAMIKLLLNDYLDYKTHKNKVLKT